MHSELDTSINSFIGCRYIDVVAYCTASRSTLIESLSVHLCDNDQMDRAVLTGKHGTLVRRAPGWQGAPDDQQAKN